MMSKSPFLDKMVTAPHFPKPDGQIGYFSTENFPDLSHTGVRTKFEPQVPPIVYSNGNLTEVFKNNSYKSLCPVLRDEESLNGRGEVFAKSHKQVMTKIFYEMEASKREMLDKKIKYMNSNKAKLGFSAEFGVLPENDTVINKSEVVTVEIKKKENKPKEKKKVHYNR